MKGGASAANFHNLYVGTETGLLKGIRVEKNHWANLNSLDNVNKQNEITAMCWSNSDQTEVCAGLRSQSVLIYDSVLDDFKPAIDCHGGQGSIRGIARYDNVFVTCVESGLLKVWKPGEDVTEINVGENIHRMQQNHAVPNSVATGGKENDLKLWDLQKPAEPVWRAKNVSNDWLNLRVPIWITDMNFMPDSKKIVASTGYHQVRVYDPSCPQRRPVLDITWDEYPITSLSLHNNTNQVMVGNTHGDMSLLDLRKISNGESLVRSYKGGAGAIRCIQCHPTLPLVASCGLDRFMRIHNIDTRELVSKFYLKSRLNCLLFSERWTLDPIENQACEVQAVPEEEWKEDNEGAGSEEEDELWSHLPKVQTKKLKRKPKHENDSDDSDENSNELPVIKKNLRGKDSGKKPLKKIRKKSRRTDHQT